MGNNISFLATQSLVAIEDWMKTTQGNVVGTTKIGFRENQVMFGGGQTQIVNHPDLIKNGKQIAEQALVSTHTNLKWDSGDIISSTESTHFAIQGEGFFMVADNRGNVYYTRSGEFYQNLDGNLVNPQGLVLVDRAMGINLGLYTPPAPTAAEINSNTAGWQTHTGNWFPYVAGTAHEEGGHYQMMTTISKYTFPMGSIAGNETVEISSDNRGFLVVNGHQLTAADRVGGGVYPSEWNQTPVMNIGPYLKDGLNTIILQVNEDTGGERAQINNPSFTDLNGQNIGTSNGRWAIEIHPDAYIGNATTSIDSDVLLQVSNPSLDNKDIIIANTGKLNQLQFSRFGANMFERSPSLLQSDFVVCLPEENNLGNVLKNRLELSNVNMVTNLTDMAALGKMYNAFIQLVSVYNTSLDEIINLIK